MRFPCLDCEARTLGCHGVCEKYATAQAARAKEHAARKRLCEAEAYSVQAIGKNKVAQIKERAKK